jgi:hypothetical protein
LILDSLKTPYLSNGNKYYPMLTWMQGNANYAHIGSGVTSFNTRTGAVTLNSTDVTTALGFTPENVTNKVTTLDNSTTHYPSTSAVTAALASIPTYTASSGIIKTGNNFTADTTLLAPKAYVNNFLSKASASSNLVPYTLAIQDVNIGSYKLLSDRVLTHKSSIVGDSVNRNPPITNILYVYGDSITYLYPTTGLIL